MSSSPIAASRNDRAAWPWPPMTYSRIRALCFHKTQSLAAVNPISQRLPPVAAIEIPAHGLFDACLERLLGAPSQLGFEFCRVDRIAQIVARAIGDEANKIVVGYVDRAQTG